MDDLDWALWSTPVVGRWPHDAVRRSTAVEPQGSVGEGRRRELGHGQYADGPSSVPTAEEEEEEEEELRYSDRELSLLVRHPELMTLARRARTLRTQVATHKAQLEEGLRAAARGQALVLQEAEALRRTFRVVRREQADRGRRLERQIDASRARRVELERTRRVRDTVVTVVVDDDDEPLIFFPQSSSSSSSSFQPGESSRHELEAAWRAISVSRAVRLRRAQARRDALRDHHHHHQRGERPDDYDWDDAVMSKLGTTRRCGLDEVCAICLSTLLATDCVTLPCSPFHVFHADCTLHFLRSLAPTAQPRCPTCRTPIPMFPTSSS